MMNEINEASAPWEWQVVILACLVSAMIGWFAGAAWKYVAARRAERKAWREARRFFHQHYGMPSLEDDPLKGDFH